MNQNFLTTCLVATLAAMPCFADNCANPTVVLPRPSHSTVKPHAPSRIHAFAEGCYDLETNELHLTILQDAGMCTLTVTSTAGDSVVEIFDSSFGALVLPLSGEPGIYVITVLTESGAETSTQFILF